MDTNTSFHLCCIHTSGRTGAFSLLEVMETEVGRGEAPSQALVHGKAKIRTQTSEPEPLIPVSILWLLELLGLKFTK